MPRVFPALVVGALVLGAAAGPTASASTSTHVSATVSELGHATAGHPATFAFRTAGASHYSINFGDHTRTVSGKRGPATRLSHTFARTGWYTVTLAVTGASHKTAMSKTKILVVSPASASASPVVEVQPTVVSARTSSATVSGYTPASGTLHTPVTITGTGFTSPASASFAGVVSSATVVNSTTITTSVPLGAGSGTLTVTTSGGPLTVGPFTINVGILPTVSVGPPTASTTVYGGGYAPNENLTFSVGGTQVATGYTTANGSFTQAVTIPPSAQPGANQLAVTGARSGLVAGTTFTVRTDWATSGFAVGTGYNPFENTINTGNVSTLKKSFTVTSAGVDGGVAVVGGIAYFGDSNGTFYAVNATTGTLVWSKSYTDGSIEDTPTVANGIVYFGDTGGILRGLNAASGALAFAYNTSDGGAFGLSNPVVANGVIYIGNTDDYLYAVNATTGALVWEYKTNAPINGSPTVANGTVFVGSDRLYCLNAATGSPTTLIVVSGALSAEIPVENGVFFFDAYSTTNGTTSGNVLAVDARSGSIRWEMPLSGVLSSPAVANGVVYVGAGTTLNALDAYTGATIWSAPEGTGISNAPAVANGVVYAVDDTGRVIGVNAATGQRLWSAEVGYTGMAQPTIVNGEVYATSYYGDLLAYSLAANYAPTG